MTQEICPCRATAPEKLEFAACCGPYLARAKLPTTAEALMRARYSAFAKGDVDYLHETLSLDQRSDFNRKATTEWARQSEWLGLEIVETEKGLEEDETGTVTFVAHYTHDGKKLTHKEKSLFARDSKSRRWQFAGELTIKSEPVVLGPQPGRNDPCPCGSGKKYKKCCGA
ncbi:YchJ family protein [uncultured Rhodoblastus sp.]|uniref:YchJ family protein n=1 Tax=uncultured Rhodoblastus sp. TaxID=543037 RepID=UPI0025E5E9CE|nr:YchJ family protein [uncultured Rhodoblastus sp.]